MCQEFHPGLPKSSQELMVLIITDLWYKKAVTIIPVLRLEKKRGLKEPASPASTQSTDKLLLSVVMCHKVARRDGVGSGGLPPHFSVFFPKQQKTRG